MVVKGNIEETKSIMETMKEEMVCACVCMRVHACACVCVRSHVCCNINILFIRYPRNQCDAGLIYT